MIGIYDYYTKYIKENSFYHYTFHNDIELYFTFNEEFKYFNEEAIISRFRILTYPSNDYSESESIEFIMLCFYLHNEGYYIDLFPNFLNRPTNVRDFSLEIREYILEQGASHGGTVTWATRRNVSNSIKFLKQDITLVKVSEDLNKLFKKISNRNADFLAMSSDEKLAEINNVIENILKVKDKWKIIDYQSETLGFLSDSIIIEYRNLVHCFRHGAEKAIEERNSFTDKQKEFLINYGTTICEVIFNSIKDSKSN